MTDTGERQKGNLLHGQCEDGGNTRLDGEVERAFLSCFVRCSVIRKLHTSAYPLPGSMLILHLTPSEAQLGAEDAVIALCACYIHAWKP